MLPTGLDHARARVHVLTQALVQHGAEKGIEQPNTVSVWIESLFLHSSRREVRLPLDSEVARRP